MKAHPMWVRLFFILEDYRTILTASSSYSGSEEPLSELMVLHSPYRTTLTASSSYSRSAKASKQASCFCSRYYRTTFLPFSMLMPLV